MHSHTAAGDTEILSADAQNPLDKFSHSLPIDGEFTNLLQTCYGETGVMNFGLNAAISSY